MGVYLGLDAVNAFGGQPIGSCELQTKTASFTPSLSPQSQTIVPDQGYNGMDEVDVNIAAMPQGVLDLNPFQITVQLNDSINVDSSGNVSVNYTTVIPAVYPVMTSGYIDASDSVPAYMWLDGSMQLPTQGATTITPSTSSQTAVTAGKYTTGAVTVNPIPSQYIVPSGDKSITANGNNIDVAQYATVSVNVSGGGGGIGELLSTTSLGTISTTSTSATSTGTSITVSDIGDYDLLIIETTADAFASNIHAGTVAIAFLSASNSRTTKTGGSIATVKFNMRYGSNSNLMTTRTSTTAYGIYPNSLTVGSGNNKVTIPMYQRYNATQTGTINASYTTRIYGVKLYELIGG